MESKIAEIHQMGIILPHERLSQTALQGLIEEFVTRDGTETANIVPKEFSKPFHKRNSEA